MGHDLGDSRNDSHSGRSERKQKVTTWRCFEIIAAFGVRWSHALCVSSLASWHLWPQARMVVPNAAERVAWPRGMLGDLLDSRVTGSTGDPGPVWRARANRGCGLYFILVFALLISLSFLSGKGNRQTCILKFVVEWWKPSAVTL